MNKSLVTNGLALLSMGLGWYLSNGIILSIGLFAFSGALTNWLAIHMLFEKIPFLYGSGVIPARFEDFKLGIRQLMMEQFFTEENIDRFLSEQSSKGHNLNLAPIINRVDLSPAFEKLISVIESSSFGGMLAMVGGREALAPMEVPFIEKMRETMVELADSEEFNQIVKEELERPNVMSDIRGKVSDIIEKRLNELTPQLVKEIIQSMIRKHLGWLVVWGGVFGGLIGALAQLSKAYL